MKAICDAMLRLNAAARAELIRRLPHVQEEVSAASAATRTDTAALDPATQRPRVPSSQPTVTLYHLDPTDWSYTTLIKVV